MVVLDHLNVPGFGAGFVGVDVFFVISGFLITSLLVREYAACEASTGRGKISIRSFYRRRVLRILPAATTTIAAVLVAAKLLLSEVSFIKIKADALWAAFFGTNIQLIREAQDYFQRGLPDSPLRNFWSLAVEEQFYIFWPALVAIVVLAARPVVRRLSWLAALRVAVVGIFVASFVWSLHLTDIRPAAAYFSTLTRAWQLALGALIAVTPALAVRLGQRGRAVAGGIGLCLLSGALLYCSEEKGYPGAQALVPTLGAGLLIIAGSVGPAGAALPRSNPAGYLLAMRLPRAIGRISYSLYLWHWPLIVFAGLIYGASSQTVGMRTGLFVVSVLIAYLSYRLIERPFVALAHMRSSGWTGPASRTRSVLMLGLIASNVAVIGLFGLLGGSSSGTLPPLGDEPSKAAWRQSLEVAVQVQRGLSPAERKIVETLVRQQVAKQSASAEDRDAELGAYVCRSRSAVTTYQEALNCMERGQGRGGIRWQPGVKRLVVLAGNSFAGQWHSELVRVLPRNVRLVPLLITGCPPWVSGKTGLRDSHGNSCDEQRHFVNRMIRRLRPGLVILSYQMETLLGKRRGDQVELTAGLVRRWRGVSGRVLFIGPPPFLKPFSLCLATVDSGRGCDRRLTRFEVRRDLEFGRRVRGVGGDYVSTQRLVCRSRICPAFIDGKPTRRDGLHLSKWTARDLGLFIADAVERAVARAG